MKNKKLLSIKEVDIPRINKLIDLLYLSCVSSGGDGDALWFSRFYDVKEILPLIERYNVDLNYPFEVIEINEGTIHWGNNQEWIKITNDKKVYESWPKWGEFVLKY